MTDSQKRCPAFLALYQANDATAGKLVDAQPTFQVEGPAREACIDLLVYACEENCEAIVAVILARKGDVNGARAADSHTPLVAATLRGSTEVATLLLRQEGLVVDCADRLTSRTALHHACQQGREEIAEKLLLHGAKGGVTASGGRTPLYLAADRGSLGCVALLLKHRDAAAAAADILRSTARYSTPLMVAQRRGHDAVARLLSDFLEASGEQPQCCEGLYCRCGRRGGSSAAAAAAPRGSGASAVRSSRSASPQRLQLGPAARLQGANAVRPLSARAVMIRPRTDSPLGGEEAPPSSSPAAPAAAASVVVSPAAPASATPAGWSSRGNLARPRGTTVESTATSGGAVAASPPPPAAEGSASRGQAQPRGRSRTPAAQRTAMSRLSDGLASELAKVPPPARRPRDSPRLLSRPAGVTTCAAMGGG
eukprot:TRINITY_DN23526_c0_g4_i3.p1 TRINITY_DN23526_c0_g4~~TRINITY_DN23526_c0_g4_i3.p1  ORF type:complete len:425 (+),score=95.73 TRINITY_DN23526_c0_g4_i3:277-1551(+)